MMKRVRGLLALGFVGVLLIFSLSGCFGPPGNVYISFDWVFAPWDWACTDTNIDTPGVVDVLYRGTDYRTVPGDYYFEYYHTESLEWHWIYYTLTAEKGFLFFTGDDSRFELYLWAFSDPDFTRLESIIASEKSMAEGVEPAEISLQTEAIGIDADQYRQKQLFEYTETQGRYTLQVRSGVWEPKE